MNKLIISETTTTPNINFDGEAGIFKISGKSLPEDANYFYNPLLEYIEEYKKNPQHISILEFYWKYFNTATSKFILSLIFSLRKSDTKLEINWYCESDFDIMIERGEELSEVVNVNFNITLNPQVFL